MARALLIANPGASRTHDGIVRQIEQVFNVGGWEVETLSTAGSGDARQFAEYGLAQGSDMVVVLGGDGTVMQAASALVGSDMPLGVLPGGTGNQLVGNLRLSFNPVRAARALLRGKSKPFDLGRLELADGVHYFAVAAGAGLDARVMSDTPREQKRRWGQLAYVATTVRLLSQVQPAPFEIEVDGVKHEMPASLAMLANCGELIPPLLKLGDGVSPYDGLLDLFVVTASSVTEGVRAVWDVVRGSQGIYGETVFAVRLTGSSFTLHTPAAKQPVQVDGDTVGQTGFSATVVPGAIQLIHPEG